MIERYFKRDRQKVFSEEALMRVIRSPLLTEKSTARKQMNEFVFYVADWADKIVIKKAVEHIFQVHVDFVNTLRIKGKTKRFKGRLGFRQDIKKAYVKLEHGSNLNVEEGGVL